MTQDTSLHDSARAGCGGGRYVYGVTEALSRVFSCPPVGPGPGPVYTVSDGLLAAVVSPSPLVTYEPTQENLAAHDRVMAEVLRECAMIPFPFGTVLRGDEEVVHLLRSSSVTLERVLRKLHDRIEFELRVLCDRDRVRATLAQQSERIRTLVADVERRAARSTYYARARLRRAVDAEMRSEEDRLVSEIMAELRAVAVASRSAPPLGERVIMTATFLVDRQDAAAFDEKLRVMSSRYRELLTFRYSGPAPPHSFLDVQLDLGHAESG